MKINYVTICNDTIGSFRYQIVSQAIELKRLGHEVIITSHPFPDMDVYLFHKHFRPEEQEMIKDIKNQPTNPVTVYIISDSHFDSRWREHYLTMIKNADRVIATTETLAGYIKDETGVDAIVIYDPWGIEFDEQKPSYSPNGKLKVMWFGHKSNVGGLLDFMRQAKNIDFTIITNPEVRGIVLDDGICNTINYSIDAMKEGFRKCDIVIIPQNLNNPAKLAKTHNRIVDSFRAGKFVIASPVNSYLVFKDWAYIGDIEEGIQWLKEQSKEEINNRIGKAQEFIRETFDPRIIAKQWEQALTH